MTRKSSETLTLRGLRDKYHHNEEIYQNKINIVQSAYTRAFRRYIFYLYWIAEFQDIKDFVQNFDNLPISRFQPDGHCRAITRQRDGRFPFFFTFSISYYSRTT